MSRDLALYLTDILHSIAKIENYTRKMTYEEFSTDEKTLDAVIHNLQIVGEATKQIPKAIRQKYGEIEWQKIAGLRDIIAHAYFNVNPKIVWDILTTKLKPLRDCIALILQNEDLS
ncbi:hypothetical protein Xen7305DRAFT_00001560 [Xenococcus sp. PCC 7305]|uniref:HepT-like ribonuclease domain-containing protein n=1 Tax=Xenococcus sp. PCC 7305 TaxID=102125 RepID=UPI0002ABCB08|nr:DUF86 domain-containing protein [Xenococcus sp. PCC 7305]ELS00455.1 hypothetical protein Xen7305DRAFT_00001560 [Xenococcus sp. PCC 7305]